MPQQYSLMSYIFATVSATHMLGFRCCIAGKLLADGPNAVESGAADVPTDARILSHDRTRTGWRRIRRGRLKYVDADWALSCVYYDVKGQLACDAAMWWPEPRHCRLLLACPRPRT
ncbi:uncharacterized protein C8Q71DRAFT_94019 [Rhodofomes roseus]|uniref:Uncharacterized protein n=1 Tax=Rhodofomes roseus TaxID=34475 RepID=A0ABQ8KEA9_9APHY|nr:uncharacterized protein C8Q71DRAFT_94019 [Rhodofomes roseus]KAH9835746.1 hypothetical protein C8Q71DRAFT_94019 [Rhodofomes roseus]